MQVRAVDLEWRLLENGLGYFARRLGGSGEALMIVLDGSVAFVHPSADYSRALEDFRQGKRTVPFDLAEVSDEP